MLDRRQHLIGIAQSEEAAIERELTVAFDELYPENIMGPIFAAFVEKFPHVQLKILVPLMDDVSELVLSGKADIGVMWRQEEMSTELDFRCLGWVPIVLICGKRHPFAAGPVAFEELKRHRQILIAPRSGNSIASRWRVASDVWLVESHWISLQLVKENIGWALISKDVLNASWLKDDLVLPDLQFDEFGLPVALDMVWNKKRAQGPAAQWLKEKLAEPEIGCVFPQQKNDR